MRILGSVRKNFGDLENGSDQQALLSHSLTMRSDPVHEFGRVEAMLQSYEATYYYITISCAC